MAKSKPKPSRFSLTPEILAELQAYSDGFTEDARQKGTKLYQSGAVIGGIKNLPHYPNDFFAIVRARKHYEVDLTYNYRNWSVLCDCSVMVDCQHGYAMILAFQKWAASTPGATAAVPATAAVQPGPAAISPRTSLRAVVESRLGRVLTSEERKFVRSVQDVFDQYGRQDKVPEAMLQPFWGRPTAWNWQPIEIWPSRPANAWETWLYLANQIRLRGQSWPDFLSPLTDEEELQRLVGPWQRRKEIAAWQARFQELPTRQARPAAHLVELRAVFGARQVHLEMRQDEGPWKPLKIGRLGTFERDLWENTLRLTPLARSLWHDFRHGHYGARCEIDYARELDDGALDLLLRNPHLVTLTLNEQLAPFHRPEAPLVWQVEAPSDATGDYRFQLLAPDGEPLPPPLFIVQGDPPLYVTADTIYPAPGLGGLPLAPTAALQIPAEAVETTPGVSLLARAGLPLPKRLSERVRTLQPKLVFEAELTRDFHAETERLQLRVLAEWDDGATVESWSPNGWETVKQSSAKDVSDDRLILEDRARLDGVASFTESLDATWSLYQNVWEKRATRKFPEQFSAWLQGLPGHVELRLDRELASLRDGVVQGSVRLEVEPSGVDWFDLSVALSVPDLQFSPAELEALLSARGGWVRLGQKGWRRLALQITEEEEESLADLGLSARDLASPDRHRLHTLQLSHRGAESLFTPDRTEELRRRASELKARVSPEIPAAITAQLRPYQIEGFHFLAYLSTNSFGGLLADDMGLGKTIQTLTWLLWLRSLPDFTGGASLVVCPKSVMENWSSEAARFAPGLRVQLWRGKTEKEWPAVVKECDLLVLNYAQLRSLQALAAKVSWHAIVLDEAQAIKNPDSLTNKAACALTGAHRLALTGTPIENRLLDLWSIMAFAMPGMLGPRARFSRLYDQKDDPLARRRLAARTRPFLLRRTKEQVAKDLPPKVEEELLCEMEGAQATLYQAELKRARQALLGLKSEKELDKARFHILSSLLRLRQICCHPGLVDNKAIDKPSAKVEALLDLLEPLMEEGRKVLVFSQFVGVLEILQSALAERGWPLFILTGQTENRGDLIADFQAAPGAAIFLLSLKASGFGLNLTSASYVVLYDPWWNPAVENQAIDRTHRIGQTSTVFAYRLIVKGTIEEKIRLLQMSKRALADDLLGEEAFARALTLDDLRALLD